MGWAWAFVWSLLWAEAGLGLPDWPWVAPPFSVSSTLYFPHLCSYHPVHTCLSLPLEHHLIFLFTQPLAQGSQQCMLKNIGQRSEDTCPPTCGREGSVLPNSPGMKLQSSVRLCCEIF